MLLMLKPAAAFLSGAQRLLKIQGYFFFTTAIAILVIIPCQGSQLQPQGHYTKGELQVSLLHEV